MGFSMCFLVKGLIVSFVTFAASIANAKITFNGNPFESTGSNIVVYQATLEGSLSDQDGKALTQAMLLAQKNGKQPRFLLALNSSGGNVFAAMAIGRILRTTESMVRGSNGSKCLSACVLILAGAPYRATEPGFNVGLHRPYSEAAEMSSPESEKAKYEKLQRNIEGYLSSMNITPTLFKDMIVIPPSKIRILTYRELEGYGLAYNEPYIDESDAMKKAQQHNISRRELLKRESLISETCNPQACESESKDHNGCMRYFECSNRIMRTGN